VAENNASIVASFDVKAKRNDAMSSGVLLDTIRLEIDPTASGSQPKLVLNGTVRVVAVDPPSNEAKPQPSASRKLISS
jgi:hypothetical protein